MIAGVRRARVREFSLGAMILWVIDLFWSKLSPFFLFISVTADYTLIASFIVQLGGSLGNI